jgi:hypothetical protein
VAAAHRVDLGVEDVADELRVGAVDDELQALARVGVLDPFELLLEGEQAVARARSE